MRDGTKPCTLLTRLFMAALATAWCAGCGGPQEPDPMVEPSNPAHEATPSEPMPPVSQSPEAAEDTPPAPETPPSAETEEQAEAAAEAEQASDPEPKQDLADEGTQPAEASPPAATTSDEPAAQPAAAPIDLASLPPVEAMPKVVMTKAHADSCLVKVGDTFPPATLNNTYDEPTELSSLYSEELTVVLFWNSSTPYGVAELRDLVVDVQKPYGPLGVGVVGINVGDSVETVRDVTERTGAEYPQLIDSDGKLYHQVATRFIPRVYLLDAQGRVLWFDMEYTVETMRHLSQAIRFQLGS